MSRNRFEIGKGNSQRVFDSFNDLNGWNGLNWGVSLSYVRLRLAPIKNFGCSGFPVKKYAPRSSRRTRRKEDFISKNAKGLRFKICEGDLLAVAKDIRTLRVLRALRGDQINVAVPDSPQESLKT
jgi:hypothetical protein